MSSKYEDGSRGRSGSRSRSRDRADGMLQSGKLADINNISSETSSVPPALTSILAAQQAAQDKVNRELFVGNVLPGTSEMLLLQFLNGAMRRIKLCEENESPILQCRVNAKFAFVECRSIEDANLILNLNGIPFLGASLKVSRPSKYTGPFVSAKTWQELTGQALLSNDAEEKINRELFIGNTTPEMTEQMLRDFLGKAMEQVGLTTCPGNPITACRVSGKFAFVELRSTQEAANALNLNNIPYLGAMLRVGRPSKYTGPVTPHGNWEDILSKYMSGELKLPQQDGGITTAPVAANTATSNPISKIVELKNMLNKEDLENDEEYNDILEDTKYECEQLGRLEDIKIPRSGAGITKIFLRYNSSEDAGKAIDALAGRTFDGRKVDARYFSEEKFAKEDYSD